MDRVRGLLIDIDGVLTVSWEPIEGSAEALAELRRRGVPVRFATNTTTRTRADVARLLTGAGMAVDASEILTAPAATAAYLRAHHAGERCFLLNSGDLSADLEGVDVVEQAPADVVVIGGAGDEFTHARLDRAFRLLLGGAAFVAMHRNLFWRTSAGFELDGGAYVLALEAASGRSPVVLGKPSAEFFATGVAELGLSPSEVAMVGDDIDSDVLGAQAAGLTGIQVRTGKFRPEDLDAASPPPDVVVDAFRDVPALLATPGTGS